MKLGVYCLHKILEIYAIPLPEEDIAKYFYSVKENDILELEDVANKLGFTTQLITTLGWKDLKKIPLPAILLGAPNAPYFLVLEKVNRWSVSVINPKTNEKKKLSKFSLKQHELKGMLLYP